MPEPKTGINAHFFIYHCECEDCPSSGESVTEEEMNETINDLIDWLGERGLIFGGSYKLTNMNEDE